MIATEIPAAIKPYSMAVAPDWSFRKSAINLITDPVPEDRAHPLAHLSTLM